MVFPKARDVVSGQLVGVGAADVLVAGFPCTDVSALNPRSRTKEHKTILQEGGRSTGSVFAAIVQFLRQNSGVRAVLLENVLGLAAPPLESSNLAVALGKLSEAGFVCKAWHLCPTMFGVPQQRSRVWIAGLRRQVLEDAGVPAAEFTASMQNLMHRLVGHAMTPLDSFLWPENHPAVQELYDSLAYTVFRPMSSEQLETCKWAQESRERSIQRHEKWWLPSWALDESLCTTLPGLRELQPRMWDVLRSHGITDADLPQVSDPRTVDLSQSADRSSARSSSGDHGGVGCFTPKGLHFHTGRCRRILGIEGLRLQNIWFNEDKLMQYPNALLQSLAGNAFSTNCCGAALLALLASFATLCMAKRSPEEALLCTAFAGEAAERAEPASFGGSSAGGPSGRPCGPIRRPIPSAPDAAEAAEAGPLAKLAPWYSDSSSESE